MVFLQVLSFEDVLPISDVAPGKIATAISIRRIKFSTGKWRVDLVLEEFDLEVEGEGRAFWGAVANALSQQDEAWPLVITRAFLMQRFQLVCPD